ncbi:DUF2207 domain-containing protein [Labedella phragmitis]|uniref:DUF2207 domain-containing protein n=1 Tax=Labedella phragmitis TaxID=2498849 RepID=A0A444PXX6_9MICO|nr:DUF2207 domain-containing protein [Labedella phragmitis]RWZ52738.1 DUF2207 domain-containing protein [Labedella phragmitis]
MAARIPFDPSAATSGRRRPRRPRSLGGAAVAAILLATATALGVPAAAHADVDDFTFESFHADLMLIRDADEHSELEVTETIVALFPEDREQNRGIVRAIPDDYDGVPLDTDVLSVTDENGEPVPFELSEDGGFLEVATGTDAFVFGERTYVISYTQRDVVRAFDDTDADEFQRDINGTGWEQPFGEVSATLTMAPELAADLTGNAACYRGEEGSSDQCEVETSEEDGSAVVRVSESDLEEEQNVSLVVGFEPGSFVPGEIERNAFERFAFASTPVAQGASIVVIVLAALAAVGAVIGRRRVRDAPGRGTIVPEYEAPRGITVMQAAHLANRPLSAVPAALVDLAVAGNVRILAPEGEETADGVTLEYVRPSDDAERQDVLVALFGEDASPGEQKTVGADSEGLAARLAALSDVAKESLRSAGLTEQARQRMTSAAIYASIGVVVVAFVAMILPIIGRAASWPGVVGLLAAVAAVIVAISVWRYRDRITDAGAPVRDHLVGLRDYLALAEADRLRVLQSPDGAERIDTGDPLQIVHVYEKLLPYAVIWGVEKQWAEVLETRVQETGAPLGWYDGSSFSSVHFLTTFGALRASAAPASAAWSGSGGGSYTGGSMGGGFSGMGSGGGGGGGR